jgi:hypothetical protein
LITGVELTTTIQTLYLAEKYIKGRKAVAKTKAKYRPQKPEIKGIKREAVSTAPRKTVSDRETKENTMPKSQK